MKLSIFLAIIMFLLIGTAFAEMPLGYPWITWGEVTQTFDAKTEKGLKIDGYLEQGIDWFKIGDTPLIFNTFLGLRGVFSDHSEDWWNNKWGPWLGLKVKYPISIKDGWGLLAVGFRWEYYNFVSDAKPYNNDSRLLGFLQWSFGGDWKK